MYRPSVLLGTPPGAQLWSGLSSDSHHSLGSDDAELIEFCIATISRAIHVDFGLFLSDRGSSPDAHLWNVWPGEHYKLLVAASQVLGHTEVIDVGTYRGSSALALLAGGASKVTTYDVEPWQKIDGTVLRDSDFNDALVQKIGNLAAPDFLALETSTLQRAHMLFVDGPKDRVFEKTFVENVFPLLKTGTFVIFDDIRLLNMLGIWNSISLPKIDLTSFGHHTGTGIVRIP